MQAPGRRDLGQGCVCTGNVDIGNVDIGNEDLGNFSRYDWRSFFTRPNNYQIRTRLRAFPGISQYRLATPMPRLAYLTLHWSQLSPQSLTGPGNNGGIFTYKSTWRFFHDLDLDSLYKYQKIIPSASRTLWGLARYIYCDYNVVFRVEISAQKR